MRRTCPAWQAQCGSRPRQDGGGAAFIIPEAVKSAYRRRKLQEYRYLCKGRLALRGARLGYTPQAAGYVYEARLRGLF